MGLHMCQQLSGINVVFFYSTSIFKSIGIERGDIATAALGAVNVLMTIVATVLMDRLGRKTWLILGLIGMLFFFSLLALACILNVHVTGAGMTFGILALIGVFGYVISFAVSLGPIPWLIVGELFPTSVRGYASSIATFLNWGCNVLIAFTFGPLRKLLQEYVFLPYCGVLLFFLIFVIFVVRETKGKTVA